MLVRGWKFYPSLRHLLLFSLGIVVSVLAPTDLPVAIMSLVVLLSVMCFPGVRLAAAALIGLPSAMIISDIALVTRRPFLPVDNLRCEVFGRVLTPVEKGERLWGTHVEADSIRYRGRTIRVTGRCRLTARDSNGPGLVAGQYLTAQGYLSGERTNVQLCLRERFSLQLDRGNDVHGIRDADGFQLAIESIRANVRHTIRRSIGGKEGGIARALVLGERTDLDRTVRSSFLSTGTIHVLALSGLHVGLIVAGLSVAISRLRKRGGVVVVLALVLGAYLLIVGTSPPIVRAVVMAVIGAVSRLVGRRTHAINTLSVASIVILLFDPVALFDVSFLLSVSAVAGIITITPIVTQRVRRGVPLHLVSVARGLGVSIGAQVGTLPVALASFGTLSTIAAPANIVVVPLIAWSMAATVFGLLVSPLGVGIDEYVFGAARLGYAACISVTEFIAEHAGQTALTFRISLPQGLVLATLLTSFVLLRGIVARTTVILLIAVALSIGVAVSPTVLPGAVLVFPAGRGDAVAVSTDTTTTIYFDRRLVSPSRASRVVSHESGVRTPLRLVDVADSGVVDVGGRGHAVVTVAPGRPRTVTLNRTRYLVIPLRPAGLVPAHKE